MPSVNRVDEGPRTPPSWSIESMAKEMQEKNKVPKSKFYLFKVDLNWESVINEFGILKVLWGYDIWFGNIPFFRTLLLANVIVWLLIS